MEGTLWIAITTLFLLLQIFLRKRRSTQQLPPGPRKFPIIGNMYQLNKGGELLHITLAKMAQQHGRIMTVWFGSQQPSIVVSDHELAWEVLVTKASDFSSRTLPYMSRITSVDWHTLATCNLGPYWQTLRKGLQTCSLNTQTISSQTQFQEQDIANLMLNLEEEASLNGRIVKPLPHLRRLVIRLICRFCFGPDQEHKKDELFVEAMDEALEEAIGLSGLARLVDVFSFTRYIPGLKLPFQKAECLKQRIKELISPYISAHKSTKSPYQNCHLNFLLSQDFSEDVVIFNLFELFLLAVDSTSTAIAWALTFMIHNEETQQKLWEELISKRRRRESVTVSVEEVRSELKYVHDVVKETMRMRPIAPVAVPHRAVRDSELKGRISVAQGTPVLVNLYAVLYDERVWREPNRFKPERFVRGGDDEKAMARSFLPFGAGRRICPGMELAKLQVAFTLANLVNRFQWCCCEVGGELPDLSEDLTFVLRMKTPLVARVLPRSS